jgi:methylmalonyl-CoA mutase C-terminal domain/subunit
VGELLKENEGDDVLVIGGGVIPDEDINDLKEAGIAEIFTPGTTTTQMIDYIKNNLKR